MATVIFDANIWIAYLNTRDSQHKNAKALVEPVIEKRHALLVPYSIVSEVYTVLTYRKQTESRKRFIDLILHHEQVDLLFMTGDVFQALISFMEQVKVSLKRNLSLTDIEFLFFATTHPEWECFTFDNDIKRSMKRLAERDKKH